MTVVEAEAQSQIAAADLRSWFFYATVQTGIACCVPVLVLGVALGQHLALSALIGAVASGAALVAVLATATGFVGMRARRPTAVIIQRTFGSGGAKLVTGLIILTSFGWYGIQTEMLVRSVTPLLQASFGVAINRPLLTAFAGVLMSTTAIIGFRALGKVAYVAVPLLLSIILVPLWRGFATHSIGELISAVPHGELYSFGMVVSIVSGTYMVGVTITPDLTRFLRTEKDTAIGVFLSLGLTYPLLLLLTATLGVMYVTNDFVAIMVQAGLAGAASLVLVLATWTSNDKNLYEAALSLSAVLPRIKRWKLTAFAGLMGTVMASAGIFDHFVDALIFLGIVVAPISGVYIVDYLFERGRYSPESPLPTLRTGPLLAWVGGIVFGVVTLPSTAHGLELLTATGVPTLDAVLAASAIHLAMESIGSAERKL